MTALVYIVLKYAVYAGWCYAGLKYAGANRPGVIVLILGFVPSRGTAPPEGRQPQVRHKKQVVALSNEQEISGWLRQRHAVWVTAALIILCTSLGDREVNHS